MKLNYFKNPLFITAVVVIITVIAFLAVFAISGHAQEMNGEHEFSGEFEMTVKYLALDLNLDDKQNAILNNAMDAIHEKMQSMKEKKDAVRTAISIEIQKTAIDQDEIMKLLEKKRQIESEIESFMAAKLSEFHAALKPEQRLLLSEKIKNLDSQAMMRQMRERIRPDGGGFEGRRGGGRRGRF